MKISAVLALSLAGLAPTGDLRCVLDCRHVPIPVGAGLPAKSVGQSMKISAVLALSLAGLAV